MEVKATKLIKPLRLTSEFVFLNEHYGVGVRRVKSGVKLIVNYQEKIYKIMPTYESDAGFVSNLIYFSGNMAVTSGEAKPHEEFEFIGNANVSKHKAVALSLLEAIKFAEKELKE